MKVVQDHKAFRYIDIFPSCVKQVNVSVVPDTNVVAGWHSHTNFDDYYLVLKGSFEFGKIKVPAIGAAVRTYQTLSEREPKVLYMPGNAYHGFRALEPNSVLLYGMTRKYDARAIIEKPISYFGWESLGISAENK